MEIYIFVKDTRFECEAENDVVPFKTMEEAKSHFNKAVRQYKKDAENDDWTIDCDTDMSFEAYEEGYECQNHYYFNILTFTI